MPNVGKSTLFNAITSTKNAEAANYPFCTIEPTSGIVAVPDKRLDKLAEIWPVSYTHLDVYKRQIWNSAVSSAFSMGLSGLPSTFANSARLLFS